MAKYNNSNRGYGNITTKGNPEQTELARLIRDRDTKVIFGLGKAGTGKTFVSVFTAYSLVIDKEYEKIIYTRNPVQCGEEIGFLAGSADEKTMPYMASLLDTLESIERCGGPLKTEMLSKIEVDPIAFMRGRNIENSILIIDEAQNLDMTSLKTLLTRIGNNSKIILLGSYNQIDNKKELKKDKCSFEQVVDRLKPFEFVKVIELIQSKRSKYCVMIDEALQDLK